MSSNIGRIVTNVGKNNDKFGGCLSQFAEFGWATHGNYSNIALGSHVLANNNTCRPAKFSEIWARSAECAPPSVANAGRTCSTSAHVRPNQKLQSCSAEYVECRRECREANAAWGDVREMSEAFVAGPLRFQVASVEPRHSRCCRDSLHVYKVRAARRCPTHDGGLVERGRQLRRNNIRQKKKRIERRANCSQLLNHPPAQGSAWGASRKGSCARHEFGGGGGRHRDTHVRR